MPKAYSYIRFSTTNQRWGDSLRRQLSRSEKFAAQHDLELDSTHRDLGVSAFKGANRHKGALASFLRKVEEGEIERGSYLIVENLDRLSREDVLAAVSLFLRIIEAGIVVITLTDDMIYSRQTIIDRPNDLTVSISAMIKANKEQLDKAERLQEAWDEKRREIADVPPAHTTERKVLTKQGPRWLDFIASDPINDPLYGKWMFNSRTEALERLFTLSQRLGRELVARALNDEGVPPFKHGDGWGTSAVLTLLKDRRVLGEFQPKSKGKPKGNPIPNYFPAAISEELFYAVQRQLGFRHSGANPARKGKVPNLFVGMCVCECGRSMEFRDKNTARQAFSEKSRYFVCSRHYRHAPGCNNHERYTYGEVERLILDWITDIKLTDTEAANATVATLKLAAKEAQRDDLKRRMSLALDDREREEDPELQAEFMNRVRAHKATIASVEAEIAALKIASANCRSVVDDRHAEVAKVRSELETATGGALFDVRSRLAAAVRGALERVTFQKDNVFVVTLRGATKLYWFQYGQHTGSCDMSQKREEERKHYASEVTAHRTFDADGNAVLFPASLSA